MRGMRSLRAVLACAVLAAGFAVPASAAPTVLYGRVLDDAGRPVRGATVRMTAKADMFGFPLMVMCGLMVVPMPPLCFDATASGVTGPDGRYSIKIRNSSLLGRMGDKSLTITERGTPELAGAYTTTEIYWAQRSLRVHDMRLWHAKPVVEPFGVGMVRVRRDPLPAAFGAATQETPSLYLLQGASGVWKYADESSDHYADARTVEAGTTGAREVAVATLGGGYRVTYFSRAVPVNAARTTPVSRGASCAAYGEGDALVPLPGCKYTDGRLGDAVDMRYASAGGKACRYPTARCAHPAWVRFDLGSVSAIHAAVVRGCTPDPTEPLGTFPAEVSVDGTTWAPFLARNPWSELVYAPPTPARYVRVDLRSCGLVAPTEVSVYGVA